MNLRLDGKRALMTGVSAGLGEWIAKMLAHEIRKGVRNLFESGPASAREVSRTCVYPASRAILAERGVL